MAYTPQSYPFLCCGTDPYEIGTLPYAESFAALWNLQIIWYVFHIATALHAYNYITVCILKLINDSNLCKHCDSSFGGLLDGDAFESSRIIL